jgi:glycosyltransferase involved in cell wall biosynthesis
MPLLTIIIPVYNAEKTIATTLDSLNRMSVESKKASEVIIINDGTGDRSIDIVESMIGALSPLTMTVTAQTNQGLSAARNTGLRQSQGEYIFFLDADDELAFDPVPVIQQHSDATALGFTVRYVRDASLRATRQPVLIGPHNHLDVFTAENAVTVSNIIFRKDRISFPFDTSCSSLEDWLFWMMNPLIFETMAIFPGITSAMIHLHGGNMTSDQNKMGKSRAKIAGMVLTRDSGRLTRKQKNNLRIQLQIGLLQQGEAIGVTSLRLIPCSFKLYSKLIVYLFAKNRFPQLFLYR